MKKYIFSLLVGLLLLSPAMAFNLPQGAEILTSPAQIAEYNILGQVGQSGEPGSYLYGVKKDEIFGAYVPVTGYQSRTTQFISASASTIPVVSTNDKAGNPIDLSQISSSGTVKVYMNLAPGTSLEEPVICTGKTTASWTGCTRGVSFQGSSETASSSLQKPHNAGTPIIITNIGQFYNQYVAVDGNQGINGTKTFAIRPRFATDTDATSPLEFITHGELSRATSTGGGVNASTIVKGVVEEATNTELENGTSAGGTGAQLYVNPASWLEYADINFSNNVGAGESVSAFNVLYISTTGTYRVAHANVQSEVDRVAAISFESVCAGCYPRVYFPGSIIFGNTVLATSSPVYLSDGGVATSTPGTLRKVLGIGLGQTAWQFNPSVQTPTNSPGIAFAPVMTTASGTIRQDLIATSSINGQILRSTSTGAFWSNATTQNTTTSPQRMDQTANRSSGVAYYNSSTVPMVVTVDYSVYNDNDSSASIVFALDTVNTAAMYVILNAAHGGAAVSADSPENGFTFIVPPGWYYKFTATVGGSAGGTANINRWTEMLF